jgi:threonine dehydratase
VSDDRPTGWGGDPVQPPDLEDVREAAERIEGLVVRTPLMPMRSYQAAADIYLKPEVLQPVGSFKIRGVGNWSLSLAEQERRRGIATSSAGNTAMALGYMGRILDVPARSHVPDSLHQSKRKALAAYGVDLVHVSMTDLMRFMFEEAWR